jgi:hypothetical protein
MREHYMKRILLVGHDPVFAWALQKKIVEPYRVEHVYTLAEAKLRISRFAYRMILLDGLLKKEIDALLENLEGCPTVFVLDDISPDPITPKTQNLFVLSKENALSTILAAIQNTSLQTTSR